MTDPFLSPIHNSNAPNTDNTAPKIAIIGGGLTGLLTATLLERAFDQLATQQHKLATSKNDVPQITIFEKSRSVGRLATRYRTHSQTDKNWQWAFGAQFFTAKSDEFLQFIQPWLDSGLLQPWCAEVVELTPANGKDNNTQAPTINKKEQWNTTHARYISTPKMTSWGRKLADNLRLTTIKFKTRVVPLAHSQANKQHGAHTHTMDKQTGSKQTELFDESGASLGHFDWVICTVPNGQAVELMAGSGFIKQAQILQPKMQACYTLMLGWDNFEQLPETLKNTTTPTWDVAYMQDSILGRIFVEHRKPEHADLLPSVTIHALNDWSEIHVDDDLEPIQAQLLVAAQQALNWNNATAPSEIDCHRWRYAATVIDKNAKEKGELGVLVDNKHNWIVSGDWCGQGNIESCYRMAMETVKVITVINNK